MLLVCFSGCVVWSEATIFTGGHPDLSPFSRAIRWEAGHQEGWGSAGSWVMHVVTLKQEHM